MIKLHQLGAEFLKEKRLTNALAVFVKISDVMLRGLVTPAISLLNPAVEDEHLVVKNTQTTILPLS